MANRLKMARVQSILSLHAQGWSRRRISRELDIDRETVSRYVQLDQQSAAKRELDPGAISKPANAPIPGPGSSALVEPPIPPIESPGSGRRSDCEPWREVIAAKRDQGLSARRIYQDLASEHSAPVSYDSVRRFMRRLGWARPLPFRRLECAPGQEAQVDFGKGAHDCWPGRQASSHACVSHRAVSLAQGLQRSNVSADHGRLPRRAGECLPSFWRSDPDADHRQP